MKPNPVQAHLDSIGVEVWRSHEVSDRKAFAWISDVGCSRLRHGVAVPARPGTGQWAEQVLHEVAHLYEWQLTGKRPGAQAHDSVFCARALELAQFIGWKPAIEACERALTEQLTWEQSS